MADVNSGISIESQDFIDASARENSFLGPWLKCANMRDWAGTVVSCFGDNSRGGISDRDILRFR